MWLARLDRAFLFYNFRTPFIAKLFWFYLRIAPRLQIPLGSLKLSDSVRSRTTFLYEWIYYKEKSNGSDVHTNVPIT